MKKNNKQKKESHKLHFEDLKSQIADLLKYNPQRSFSANQILQALKSKNTVDEVDKAVVRLIQSKRLVSHKSGKVQYAKGVKAEDKEKTKVLKSNLIEGRIEVIRSGSAYLISDQSAEDAYIPQKFLNGAVHGDIVQVAIIPGNRRKPDGKVVNVIRRETTLLVGTVRRKKSGVLVYPTSQYHSFDIHVSDSDSLQAEDGDKVIVQITQWKDGVKKTTKGKITQILSGEAIIDNEMKSILVNNGFALEFSAEANAVAEKAASGMKDGLTWPDRRDFRSITTFTIDPDTAKDFDDALSYIILPDGNLEIGVHIADASHYLEEGTILDQEAYAKSTSVYLVDRALPMLPEVLSSDVCSLNPFTDRLTFSVVFTINPSNKKIVKTWIGKSIIHSNHRFTYENAQEILDKKEGVFYAELNSINELAKAFRKKRFENGSIGFDSPEFKFKLDKNTGLPVSVYEKEHIETHALIEEFMLLANKAVAEFIHHKEKNQDVIPFVYRVHDLPDLDKLNDLATFAKELGFTMKINTPKEISKSLNALYEASKTNDALKMLQPLGIRSMAKAEYSTNNIGHYGLAFTLYSHFTSPIRRYSDILAHRILFQNLSNTVRVNKKRLEEQCKHISNQERKAMDAERESTKFFQVLYIKDQIGNEFNGTITGMIERGLFVELNDSHVEGFIPFENWNERFVMAENRLKAFGRSSGLMLHMGDKLKVKIEDVDTLLKRVELSFVSKI